MKITEDVRKYAVEEGLTESRSPRMQQKSVRENGQNRGSFLVIV
jgi:hypothetical protein